MSKNDGKMVYKGKSLYFFATCFKSGTLIFKFLRVIFFVKKNNGPNTPRILPIINPIEILANPNPKLEIELPTARVILAKALTLNFLYLIDRFIKDSQMPYNKIYKGINIECHFILSKPPEKILKIGKIIVAIIAQ